MILSDSFVKPFEDYVKEIHTIFPDIQFVISLILSKYDTDLQKQYHVLLYRFASVIAKTDGVISETEQQWLNELLKLNEPETLSPDEKTPKIHHHTEKSEIKDSQTELQSLIGLSSVKSEILTLVNFLKIQKQRQLKGLKTSQPSYHCIFTGNPGTGKTTVARIVAEIYKELNILKKGHLIETDRSGLIAEYVGQTAVKTNKIIDSALDGVLFIDEAYSLIGGGNNDYGKEAIATLLKRMEDNRDRLVVILAGYTAEMKNFIDSNPGLQSRFNRYIDFPDYSAEELYQIFELNLKKFDYTISSEACKMLQEYFQTKVSKQDNNFGNARFVRNLLEKTLEHQANRLAKETNLTTEKLSEIILDDIKIE
ncbi:MAG: AAA family ATPase [Bacteroidales bacterium]|nr:AAA family ATPase [Bacteroidales bacterium]